MGFDLANATGYEVRYTATIGQGASWAGATIKANLDINTSSVSIENLRRGTFFIQATGPCYTESLNAAVIVSDVVDSEITLTCNHLAPF